MTSVIIAPRVEDAESDVERIVAAGFFQLRPSKTYISNGQWVQSSWSDPVAFDGTAKIANLDALPDNPYELYAEYPDGRGDVFVIREYRTVTDSATPVKWETLALSDGPGSTVPVPTNFEARLAALETAMGNVSGGASNLAGITNMSALMRQVNTRTTPAAIRDDIDAAADTHSHAMSQITGITGSPDGTKALFGDFSWKVPPAAGAPAWTDITGKPSAFPPSGHGHVIADVDGLATALGSAGGTQVIEWTGSAYSPAYDTSKTVHIYKDGPSPLALGLPFGAADEYWKLNTPAPAPANTISIGSAKRALAGTDIVRGTGQIVRYTRTVSQTVTPTGPGGVEVVVSLLTGLVVSRNDRVASGSTTGTAIPADSYVLSGEGKGSGTAGQWLLDNATVGAAVVLTQETTPPTDTPSTPSGLADKPIIMNHAGYLSTAPAIGTYPSTVLAEVNTIVLNYGQAATAGTGTLRYTEASGQTAAALLTAVNAHKAAGRDVFLAIGGGGGSDGGITVTNDVEADQMVASVKSLVSSIGINGVVLDIQSTRWTQAAIVRVATRLKADLGAGFVIGMNNKSAAWIQVAVALASNLDFMAPGLWAQVEATDSRLTALTTSTIATIVSAGVPAEKIMPTYSLGAAGDNLTPTASLVDTAWQAAKSAQPNLRGIGFFDDASQSTRSWDGPLTVGPTVRGVQSGRVTSFTATRNGTAPTTAVDLAWTYAGSAGVSGWSITRAGGGGGTSIISQPASAARAFADTGLTANTAYTYTLTGTLSTGETITATATVTTGATSTPPSGTWMRGASCIGVADGSFGTWRGSSVPMMRTWSTVKGSQGPAAFLGSWQFDAGAEYANWLGHGEWSPGGLYKSIGETWAAAASGAYDSRWSQGITNVKNKWLSKARGTLYISPFHEMNGNWFDHSVSASEAPNFILAWRRFYNIAKTVFPACKIVFNTNGDTSGQSYRWDTAIWPGAQYVDVYSTDWYSNHWVACGRQINTKTDGFGAPYGLEGHRQFALSQGLPFSIPEWGVNNDGAASTQTGVATGDVPDFIVQMWNWLNQYGGSSGAGAVIYETFFNSSQNNAQFQFYPVTKSQYSAAKYRELW